jgi:hypothetical protein
MAKIDDAEYAIKNRIRTALARTQSLHGIKFPSQSDVLDHIVNAVFNDLQFGPTAWALKMIGDDAVVKWTHACDEAKGESK